MDLRKSLITGGCIGLPLLLLIAAKKFGLIGRDDDLVPDSGGGSGGGGSGGGGSMSDGSTYSVYKAAGYRSNGLKRRAFVSACKSKLGKPYLWGHRGPDSFDCSGLVDWAYGQCGVDTPPVVTGQSAEAPFSINFSQPQTLTSVRHLLKKGYCIGIDYTFGGKFSHVLIVAGNNKIIQASGKEACPCEGSRCKVVMDPYSRFTGTYIRSIYSWL